MFVPENIQTLVRAVDCTSTASITTNHTGSQSGSQSGTVADTLTWDRDVSVECFEGDHLLHYAIPTAIMLPPYTLCALRLSIVGGSIDALPYQYQGHWLAFLLRGRAGFRDTWWGESKPLVASTLTTTSQAGKFSLVVQVTQIVLLSCTLLFTTHPKALSLSFIVLVGANVHVHVLLALALPVYIVNVTQAAYESMLVLGVWTVVICSVVDIVIDPPQALPSWIWYVGLLVWPVL